MERLTISQSIYIQIMETVGSMPPETGGILGGDLLGHINYYYFDRTSSSDSVSYKPDTTMINTLLRNIWMPRQIYMVGIVHSHHNEFPFLSCGDIQYGIQILNALDIVDSFFLPIVTSSYGLIPYTLTVLDQKPIVKKLLLEIVKKENIEDG